MGFFCMELIEGEESAWSKQPPATAVWTAFAQPRPPKSAARLTGRLGSVLSRAKWKEAEMKSEGGRWGAVWGH